MKSKGPTLSFHAEFINLDNPLQTQFEVGRLNQQPFFDSVVT